MPDQEKKMQYFLIKLRMPVCWSKYATENFMVIKKEGSPGKVMICLLQSSEFVQLCFPHGSPGDSARFV